MRLFIFLLNLPYTLTGLLPLILSIPYKIQVIKNPIAFIFKVKGFWWAFGYLKNARAMAIGHIILLGPKELRNDLEHEIIHVKQWEKYPLIYPILYYHELITKGYRQNRFEDEAYTLSNSTYEPPNP